MVVRHANHYTTQSIIIIIIIIVVIIIIYCIFGIVLARLTAI